MRYRTVGDATCTAAVESSAATLDDDHRRGRGLAHHRAGRDPRRRQVLRSGHGRPQARGLLLRMELLRFATAGSVDDGKSTLIGRLLYDSKQIFEDTLEAIEHTSRLRGEEGMNLALLTDGLRAEREQGITIDVAYRYFATPTPQVHHRRHARPHPVHAQHGHRRVDRRPRARSSSTPATASSSSRGATRSSRRCSASRTSCCASTRWTSSTTTRRSSSASSNEFREFAAKLDVHDLAFIPISALHGDNVVERSANMPWYEGSSLLHHLEEVHIASDRNLIDCRFPVQYVIRPRDDQLPRLPRLRGPGRRAAPTRRATRSSCCRRASRRRIASIDTADGPVEEATPPMSVTIRLEDDLDVSRGDMICRPQQPAAASARTSTRCSAGSATAPSSRPGAKYAIKHTSQVGAGAGEGPAVPPRREHAAPRRRRRRRSSLNEIGRVTLRTTQPLFFDEYRRNRAHRLVHPRRRSDQRHRRRRHDPRPHPVALATRGRRLGAARVRTVVHEVAAAGFGDPADYEAARPSYPPEARRLVRRASRHRAAAAGCCDLAAGTGKLTRLLARDRRRPASRSNRSPGCARRSAACCPSVPLLAATAEAMPFARRRRSTRCSSRRRGTGSTTTARPPRCARVVRPGGGVGLVWNARDRSVAVGRRESGRSWTGSRSGRRGATTRTGAISALGDCPGSAPLRTAEFRHVQALTPEQVVQRVASVSHVAVLPDAERAAVLDEVRARARTHRRRRRRAYRDCSVELPATAVDCTRVPDAGRDDASPTARRLGRPRSTCPQRRHDVRPRGARARPARRRSCCCTAGSRAAASTGSRRSTPLGEHFRVIAPDLRGHAPRPAHAPRLPARRLRRRLRGDARRARHRPGDRGRLLDGRAGRAAAVAPPPRPRRRARALRDRAPASCPNRTRAARVPVGDARPRRRGAASRRSHRALPVAARAFGAGRDGCPRGSRPRCAATTGA